MFDCWNNNYGYMFIRIQNVIFLNLPRCKNFCTISLSVSRPSNTSKGEEFTVGSTKRASKSFPISKLPVTDSKAIAEIYAVLSGEKP